MITMFVILPLIWNAFLTTSYSATILTAVCLPVKGLHCSFHSLVKWAVHPIHDSICGFIQIPIAMDNSVQSDSWLIRDLCTSHSNVLRGINIVDLLKSTFHLLHVWREIDKKNQWLHIIIYYVLLRNCCSPEKDLFVSVCYLYTFQTI